MFVYLLTNAIDEKKYVGKTEKTVEERWREHVSNSHNPKKQEYLYRAMRKHGVDNFSRTLLATASSAEELNDLERRFIQEMNTLSPNGYNMTYGGEGVRGTDEVRQKIRNKALGRATTQRQKDVASLTHKGKPKSDEQKAKMAAAWDEKKRRKQAAVARRVNKVENAKLQDFTCPDCGKEFHQVSKGVYGGHRRACVNYPETKMWEFATMHAEGVFTYKEMAEKLDVYPQTLFNWAKRMGLPPRRSR